MNHDNEHDPENQLHNTPAHRAYAAADGLIFRGKELEPFSPRRLMAAQGIGLRLWEMTPEEIESCTKLNADGKVESFIYPGMARDATVIVYLCQCPKADVVLAAQDKRSARLVLEKALDWADEIGIGHNDPELYSCFGSILNGISDSAAEPVPTKENGAASGNGKGHRRGARSTGK